MPAFNNRAPLSLGASAQSWLCTLYGWQETGKSPAESGNIVWMRYARYRFENFAVPDGVEVFPGTLLLPVDVYRVGGFTEPGSAREVPTPILLCPGMQWLMHVSYQMHHPCQRHGPLWQWRLTISQNGALVQQCFQRTHPIRAISLAGVFGVMRQIYVVALPIKR
jgi:hypothetical protein